MRFHRASLLREVVESAERRRRAGEPLVSDLEEAPHRVQHFDLAAQRLSGRHRPIVEQAPQVPQQHI